MAPMSKGTITGLLEILGFAALGLFMHQVHVPPSVSGNPFTQIAQIFAYADVAFLGYAAIAWVGHSFTLLSRAMSPKAIFWLNVGCGAALFFAGYLYLMFGSFGWAGALAGVGILVIAHAVILAPDGLLKQIGDEGQPAEQ